MPETLELLIRRAELAPASFNEATRTVDMVWSTGADVRRRDFEGPFIERLSMAPEAVNLGRLVNGPVLNSHQQRDLGHVLGVVRSAKVTDAQGRATVEFSQRPDVAPIVADVRAGIIRHVSVGYTVEEWTEGTDPTTGERVRTATKWTPHEVSLVPVAADPNATTRNREEPTMPETTAAPAQTRAEINQNIRSIATVAGLDAAFANGLIDRGATVDQARAAAFDELARRGGGTIRTQTTSTTGVDNSDPAVRAAWIGEALYLRVNPAHTPSEPARQFVGLTLPEIAREILRHRGIATTGMSPATLVTRAMHTTSDFPLILGSTVNRTLRAAYEAAPAGVRQLARQTTAKDFRAKYRLQLGEAPTLEKVNEHGEIKGGTMAEARETYSLATYAKQIGISRQAIINDDLGAFADLSRRFGIAAAEFEAQTLVDLLISGSGNGPTMSDTVALFNSAHGNKAGSGAAPSATTFTAARLAMRKQTGLSGKIINVIPKFVLVPADLETTAQKEVAAITPAQTSNVNPFDMLVPIVEPRLTSATRWYMVADPAQFDGLEYSYLEGAPGPQIESRQGWDTLGVEIRIFEDFGCGFVDWRGWYMNPGV